jgi:hypothetical protein
MATFFRISTIKNYLGSGGTGWANTYEVEAIEQDMPVSDPTLLSLVNEILIPAERSIHLTSTYFNRAVISTYAEDSTPYDATESRTISVGEYGQRSTVVVPQDLTMVLKIRRDANAGLPGTIPYRNVLGELDVSAGAQGRWILDPASDVANAGALFITYKGFMADMIGINPLIGLRMVKLGKRVGPPGTETPQSIKIIESLTSVGVGTYQLNRRTKKKLSTP